MFWRCVNRAYRHPELKFYLILTGNSLQLTPSSFTLSSFSLSIYLAPSIPRSCESTVRKESSTVFLSIVTWMLHKSQCFFLFRILSFFIILRDRANCSLDYGFCRHFCIFHKASIINLFLLGFFVRCFIFNSKIYSTETATFRQLFSFTINRSSYMALTEYNA